MICYVVFYNNIIGFYTDIGRNKSKGEFGAGLFESFVMVYGKLLLFG